MPSPFYVRLTHTGVFPGGRPNRNPIQIPDLDTGLENQLRKVPVYVPYGGFIDIPLSSRSLLSVSNGAIAGFVAAGMLTSHVSYGSASTIDNDSTVPGARIADALDFLLMSGTFQQAFVNADLVANVLTVVHGLGNQYNIVQVYDDTNKMIIPDQVSAVGVNTTDIDLTSFSPIVGTWYAVIRR